MSMLSCVAYALGGTWAFGSVTGWTLFAGTEMAVMPFGCLQAFSCLQHRMHRRRYRWMGSSPAAVLKVMHLDGFPIPSIRAAAAAKLACTHMFISLSGVNHLSDQAQATNARQPAHRSPKELDCSKCASPYPPLGLTTATSGKFSSCTKSLGSEPPSDSHLHNLL